MEVNNQLKFEQEVRDAKPKYAEVGHVTCLGQSPVLVSSHPPYMEVSVGFVPDGKLGSYRTIDRYNVPNNYVCGFLGQMERKLVTQLLSKTP